MRRSHKACGNAASTRRRPGKRDWRARTTWLTFDLLSTINASSWTNDADFLRLHRQGVEHGGIAYFPEQQRPVGELIRMLVLLHEVVSEDGIRGRIEFM